MTTMAFESTRGKLAQKDFDLVQDNFVYLKENLEARDIVDYLFQCRVITIDEKLKISSAKTKPERNDLLLAILLQAGPGASFQHFLASLDQKYQHVLEKLGRNGLNVKSPACKRQNIHDTSSDIQEQQTKASCSKKRKTVDNEIKEIQDEVNNTEEQAKTMPAKKRKYTKRAKSSDAGEQQIKTPRSKSSQKNSLEMKAQDEICKLKEENEKIGLQLKAKDDQILQLKKANDSAVMDIIRPQFDAGIDLLKKKLEKTCLEIKAKDAEICKLKEENETIGLQLKAKDDQILQLKEEHEKALIAMKLKYDDEMFRLRKEQDTSVMGIINSQLDAEVGQLKKELEQTSMIPNKVAKKKEKEIIRLVSREDFQKCVELVLRKQGKDHVGIKSFWVENLLVKSAENQPGMSKETSRISKLNRIDLLKAKYKTWEIYRDHKKTALRKEIKRYLEEIGLVLNTSESRSFWKSYEECLFLASD